MKLNDYYYFTVGSHFLSAIINADCSGLDDSDERALNDFIANLPPAAVGGTWDVEDYETHFNRCEVTDLHSDCVNVSLHFYNPELVVPRSGDEENLLY
jgi:hypothetical protein